MKRIIVLFLLLSFPVFATGLSGSGSGISATNPNGVISATGSLTFPNGLALNWGPWTSAGSQAAVAVTFNKPFASAAFALTSSCSSASTTAAQTWYDSLATTGANLRGQVGSLSCTYFAIGQ